MNKVFWAVLIGGAALAGGGAALVGSGNDDDGGSGDAVTGSGGVGDVADLITFELIVEAAPWAKKSPLLNTEAKRQVFLADLRKAARYIGIHSKEGIAMFVGQLAWESGSFWYSQERMTDAEAEQKYGYKTRRGRNLGNTKPGDGRRFKGRGFIQLTGRYNYEKAGKALNLDLVNNPGLAERAENRARVSAWYYKESRKLKRKPNGYKVHSWDNLNDRIQSHGKGLLTDEDFRQVTMGILGDDKENPKTKHLFHRTDRAKKALRYLLGQTITS